MYPIKSFLRDMMDSYRLIDSGDFKKLEQFGPYRFVRPSPQAVWRPRLPESEWRKIDAFFNRFTGGNGRWGVINRKLPDHWTIEFDGFSLIMQRTDFGHLGIFPEQKLNWQRLRKLAQSKGNPLKILNLFAYTGASTLACASSGSEVVHVDASKTSVSWARENAKNSGLTDAPVRWIVDDVRKFVEREVRRDSKYDGIILDPPSFGRGPKGQAWKIEDDLNPLMDQLKHLLSDNFQFVMLSCHSSGYTPLALQNLMGDLVQGVMGTMESEEMILEETESQRALPSGATCLFVRQEKAQDGISS